MEVTKELEKHLTANMNISKKDIMVGNFLGGVFWGLGTLVGAVMVGAIIYWILKSTGLFGDLTTTLDEINSLKSLDQIPQEQNYR